MTCVEDGLILELRKRKCHVVASLYYSVFSRHRSNIWPFQFA